jgi:nucleoside-diphosphate-sugar epimerase
MPSDRTTILVIGAAGQIGTELVAALRSEYGEDRVVAGCHTTKPSPSVLETGPVEFVDATDRRQIGGVVQTHNVGEIYNLASILSGEGELHPDLAWDVNLSTHKNVLDIAVERNMTRVFWPSSIAVFGGTTPPDNTPQQTVLEPETMYGVTKVAGENLCNYYFHKYKIDIRSVRFPGLITVEKFSGGGTSDYTVEMILSAMKATPYECFVRRDTRMPLMAMRDAISATMGLMQAPAASLTVRTSYNVGSLTFTAGELEEEIKRHRPEFRCTYVPDFRQTIADSWPNSLDDTVARRDWNWREKIDLPRLVADILSGD